MKQGWRGPGGRKPSGG